MDEAPSVAAATTWAGATQFHEGLGFLGYGTILRRPIAIAQMLGI